MSLDITLSQVQETDVYDANITHNLNEMAEALGIYKALWRPEEIGITKANQLIKPLRKAIEEMEDHPSVYKKLDADNGWGTYGDFLPWLRGLLHACVKHPEAKVTAYR